MSYTWIKLYHEIIDDPKMGRLPDWLWRRAIELFLLAGENGNDGLLQPVTDLAWRLRTSEEKLTESLQALSEVGVVHETPQGWVVTNFKKRQERIAGVERVRQYRERKRTGNESVTKRYTSSNEADEISSISTSSSVSESQEEGGQGEKPIVPIFWKGKDLAQVWETVSEHMRPEMTQRTAMHLDSCLPIAWDENTFTLTVQAAEPDWLNQRLAKSAGRFMVGLLNVDDPKIVFVQER